MFWVSCFDTGKAVFRWRFFFCLLASVLLRSRVRKRRSVVPCVVRVAAVRWAHGNTTVGWGICRGEGEGAKTLVSFFLYIGVSLVSPTLRLREATISDINCRPVGEYVFGVLLSHGSVQIRACMMRARRGARYPVGRFCDAPVWGTFEEDTRQVPAVRSNCCMCLLISPH